MGHVKSGWDSAYQIAILKLDIRFNPSIVEVTTLGIINQKGEWLQGHQFVEVVRADS